MNRFSGKTISQVRVERVTDELTAWQQRAIQAEGKLRELACIPNDSIGWKEMREAAAKKALDELDIPGNILIYLRNSADTTIPAELCVRDQEGNYNVWGMSSRALYNLVRVGVGLMSQEEFFSKK
jgi:hypothetical protein